MTLVLRVCIVKCLILITLMKCQKRWNYVFMKWLKYAIILSDSVFNSV